MNSCNLFAFSFDIIIVFIFCIKKKKMFVAPINPNSVTISLIQTGCLKSEFDSIYPIHLNGIIRQDEFQESIKNINKIMSSRKSLIIVGIIFIICLIGGIVLFIVGGVTAATSRLSGFPVLVGVGLGVFFLSMLVIIFGCCCIQTRRTTKMYQAVANESIKYSTRSPTPCSWRLNASRSRVGYGRNRRTVVHYTLVIEIGNSVGLRGGNVPNQFNQRAPSPSYFPQQNNMPPPPPSYYGQSTAGFCSRCGMTRQNSPGKFCSSCGQTFS